MVVVAALLLAHRPHHLHGELRTPSAVHCMFDHYICASATDTVVA